MVSYRKDGKMQYKDFVHAMAKCGMGQFYIIPILRNLSHPQNNTLDKHQLYNRTIIDNLL